MTTLERVTRVLVELRHAKAGAALNPETPLTGSGLGLSSFDVLEMLLALEKDFRVGLSAYEIERANALQSIGRLADFIDAKTGAGK